MKPFVLTVFFWFFGKQLLWLFGCSEQTIVYALPYMQIYVSGSIFVMLALGMNLFITTQGFTRFSMTSVLIGAGANIILDPIFIYGCIWASAVPLWQQLFHKDYPASGS